MELVLRGLQWQICLVYLDDIIIVGKTVNDMIANLTHVFDRLVAAGLKPKARKCTLFATEAQYLGHVVSEQGISTHPDKIAAVQNWETPTNISELRSFVGFCSYYRRFVKPLHDLTKKGTNFM